MGPASWKNASTLIVLARNRLSQMTNNNVNNHSHQKQLPDFSCMLLKRSAQSKFFAKAFVFPGGASEVADFSPNWLKHFSESGFDREQLASEFIFKHRIPLYVNASTLPDCIPEISYRISAIRETFEETGVLFCKPIGSDRHALETSTFVIDDLPEWQERVHQNPEQFLLMCQKYKLCPDVWSIYEWSNWLTPANMGPKRYDTIFYITVVDSVPNVKIDGTEITQIRWIDPISAVWDHVKGEIWLAPPQMYELCRLAHFSSAEDLKIFAERRQQDGTERWLPIRRQAKDGLLTILPGDSLYTDNDEQNVIDELEKEEFCFENSGTLKNRMFFAGPSSFRIGCNIIDPHGHKQPINLVDKMTEAIQKSKM